MKLFVVNLDRSPERLAETQRLFGEAGLSFERVPAVDGAALSPAERRRLCPPLRFRLANAMRPPKPGEIGCALSHRKVWDAVTRQGEAIAGVFEDDVAFDAPALREALETARRENDPDVPTVWLLQTGLPMPGRSGGRRCYDILETRDVGHVFSTYAYLLNRAAAARLAALQTPVVNMADTWSAYARCGVRILAFFRPCASVRKVESTIAYGAGGLWRFGWFRRLFWARWRLFFRVDLALKLIEGKRRHE
ncbi:MAG: glycosyltransferase family 25 protein [Kiritimatiellae bacterium]|nr:glycosyltransferase family 25 protein [Kiritimatiellia bacterium]